MTENGLPEMPFVSEPEAEAKPETKKRGLFRRKEKAPPKPKVKAEAPQRAPESTDEQVILAQRFSLIWGVTMIFAFLIFAYIAINSGRQWQMFVYTGEVVVMALSSFIAYGFARRGNAILSGSVLIYGVIASYMVMPVIAQGSGIVGGVLFPLFTAAIALAVLPQRRALAAIGVSLALSAVSLLLEVNDSPLKLFSLELQIASMVIGVGGVVAMATLLAMQIRGANVQRRLTIIFILLSIVPSTFIGGYTVISGTIAANDETLNLLDGYTALNEDKIDLYIQDLTETLQVLFPQSAEEELAGALAHGVGEEYQDALATMETTINDVLEETPALENIMFLNENGRVVVTGEDAEEEFVTGSNLSDRDYFSAGMEEEYVSEAYFEEEGQVYTFFIALPFKDEHGHTTGVLAAETNFEPFNEMLATGRQGLGESGELYLVTADYQMSTDSLYEGYGIGTEARTEGVTAALESQRNQSGLFENYFSNPVLGNYHLIPELNAVLVAEIAQNEISLATFQEGATSIFIGLAVTALAVVVSLVISQGITNPLDKLLSTTRQVAAGDYSALVEIESQDELGALAESFNTMTSVVSQRDQELEVRARELEERSREMEASQRVTFAASERTTPDDFLELLVNLIADQFDVYHTQVYMVDNVKQNAILQQSTGYAGRQLLQRGHHIPLDQEALVTRCINTGEPVLVANVAENPAWLPNPLLPYTQSELVVPLKVEDDVIGALDIQDRVPGRFTEQTVPVFATMTEHVASLFQTTELMGEIDARTEDLQKFANQLRAAAEVAGRLGTILDPEQLLSEAVTMLQSNLDLYHAHIYLLDDAKEKLVVRSGSGSVGLMLKERKHNIALNAEASLVARSARERVPVLVTDVSKEPGFMANPLLPETRSELAVPLIAAGNLLGVLDIQDDTPGRFTETDADSISTLAGQIATAIDNARLFGEVERSAEETQMRYEISRQLNEAVTNEDLILALSQPAMRASASSSNLIYLESDEAGQPEWGEVVANWRKSDALDPVPVGTRFYLPEFPFTNVWLAETDRPQYIADVNTDKNVDDMTRAAMLQGGSQANCVIPIHQAGRWIALISYNWESPHEFSQEEKDLYETLLGLASPAVTSQRLGNIVRRSLDETRLRLEINQALAGNLTEDEVLDIIVENAGIYPNTSVDILLMDPQAEEPTFVGVRDEPFDSGMAGIPAGMRIPFKEYPMSNFLSPHDTFISDDVYIDERVDEATRGIAKQMGSHSVAIVPLSIGEDWLGIISASSRDVGFFNSEKALLYQTLADQGAVALRAARLRAESEHAQSLVQNTIDGVSDPVMLIDSNYVVRFMNQAVRDNLREEYKDRELLHCYEISHHQNSPCTGEDDPCPMPIILKSRDNTTVVHRHSMADGSLATLELHASPMFDDAGNLEYFVESAHDVTERTKYEKGLIQTDKLKSEFLANMSHELRTPLNSIIGYTDVLLLGVDGDLNEEMRKDMEAIQDNSNHLLRLINDVLDLAKIEAGRMTFELSEVDIEELYHETIKANSGLLINKSLQMKTDVQSGLPKIVADKIRLSQVITNLVSNAIKFTEEGTITLRAKREGDWVRLEVEDTGKGIEREHLEIIFEEFTQADPSSTRTVEGTGLGLAISRHLIHMHGGEITVESVYGKGSNFIVRLPIQSRVRPEVIVTNGNANEKVIDLLKTK